jgi:hypothetical protein
LSTKENSALTGKRSKIVREADDYVYSKTKAEVLQIRGFRQENRACHAILPLRAEMLAYTPLQDYFRL